MREYRYKNGTVYVHGEVDKERLKKAMTRFMRNVYKYRAEKEREENGSKR